MRRTTTILFLSIMVLPLSVTGQGIADSAAVDTIVVKPKPSCLTLPAHYYQTKIDYSLSPSTSPGTPNLSGYEVYRLSQMQCTLKGAGMGMTAGFMAGAFGEMAGAWNEDAAFAIAGAHGGIRGSVRRQEGRRQGLEPSDQARSGRSASGLDSIPPEIDRHSGADHTERYPRHLDRRQPFIEKEIPEYRPEYGGEAEGYSHHCREASVLQSRIEEDYSRGIPRAVRRRWLSSDIDFGPAVLSWCQKGKDRNERRMREKAVRIVVPITGERFPSFTPFFSSIEPTAQQAAVMRAQTSERMITFR